jgi:hypothetical protein
MTGEDTKERIVPPSVPPSGGTKWGLTSGAAFGKQVNTWDLSNVSGIEHRKGMTTEAIVVQAAGAMPVTKFGRMDKGPGPCGRRLTPSS